MQAELKDPMNGVPWYIVTTPEGLRRVARKDLSEVVRPPHPDYYDEGFSIYTDDETDRGFAEVTYSHSYDTYRERVLHFTDEDLYTLSVEFFPRNISKREIADRLDTDVVDDFL